MFPTSAFGIARSHNGLLLGDRATPAGVGASRDGVGLLTPGLLLR